MKKPAKFRHYVRHMGVTREVFPIKFDNSFTYERPGEEVFFRKSLKGRPLSFNNRNGQMDFSYFHSIDQSSDRCQEISYWVDKYCPKQAKVRYTGGSVEDWAKAYGYRTIWRGYFAANDGEYDLNLCKFTVKPLPDDDYRCILDNQDKQTNIMGIGTERTVSSNYDIIYEEITCGPEIKTGMGGEDITAGCYTPTVPDSWRDVAHPDGVESSASGFAANGCINPADGWQEYQSTFKDITTTPSNYQYEVYTKYRREKKVTYDDIAGNPVTPPGAGWILNGTTTLNGQPAHIWVRPPYNGAYTQYIYDYYSIPCTVLCTQVLPATPGATYTHNRTLQDVLEWVGSYYWCPKIGYTRFNVVSDFFSIDGPGTAVYDSFINAVAYQRENIMIAHKSDIIDPVASEPASRGMLSFKEMMQALRVAFNIRWYMQDYGTMRVEHVSFFQKLLGYNLKADQETPGDKNYERCYGRSYKYLKEKMPDQEKFTWMEAKGGDFIGLPIQYIGPCVTAGTSEEFSPGRFTADIDFIQHTPGDISKDGFVILATDGTNVINDAGFITGDVKPNMPLSWANLHFYYHRYERVLLTGSMNGVSTVFYTAKRTKQQNGERFVWCMCCEDFDPMKLIRTRIGDGEVTKAEWNADIEVIEVELLH
jgi:hypothetical protein